MGAPAVPVQPQLAAPSGRQSRSRRTPYSGSAQRAKRVASMVTASTPPVAVTTTTSPLAQPEAPPKALTGKEVEEAAMWQQIRLHESWSAGTSCGGADGWQGPELLQAYNRFAPSCRPADYAKRPNRML